MMPRLYAARYDAAGTTLEEFILEPSNVSMRWELPFGPIRAEVTIKNKSPQDGYERYTGHHGQRFCVLDNYLDRPVFDGWVYEIRYDKQFTHYIIGGPFFRHQDVYYEISDLPASGNTDAIIKDILTDAVTVVSSDQSNIGSTGTDSESWEPEEHGGTLPDAAIKELALMSDSSGNQWDYWVKTAPLSGVLPQDPIPYFAARSTSATVNWRVNRGDMALDSARLSRNIWGLKRVVEVHYGLITGTHSAIANSANLIDSASRNFIDEGVRIGDKVINVTDGSSSNAQGIIDQGAGTKNSVECVLSGGTDDDWDVGDSFVIKLEKGHPTQSVTASSSETDLWAPEYTIHMSNMTQTQAEQFRDALLAQFEKVASQQSFVVTAPTIKGTGGESWPLWQVIKDGGGYIQADVFTDADLLTLSLDKKKSLRITALDYDYRRNRLRILPDNEDGRLDAILKRGKLVRSTQVQA